jgi:hypothetical protein
MCVRGRPRLFYLNVSTIQRLIFRYSLVPYLNHNSNVKNNFTGVIETTNPFRKVSSRTFRIILRALLKLFISSLVRVVQVLCQLLTKKYIIGNKTLLPQATCCTPYSFYRAAGCVKRCLYSGCGCLENTTRRAINNDCTRGGHKSHPPDQGSCPLSHTYPQQKNKTIAPLL